MPNLTFGSLTKTLEKPTRRGKKKKKTYVGLDLKPANI